LERDLKLLLTVGDSPEIKTVSPSEHSLCVLQPIALPFAKDLLKRGCTSDDKIVVASRNAWEAGFSSQNKYFFGDFLLHAMRNKCELWGVGAKTQLRIQESAPVGKDLRDLRTWLEHCRAPSKSDGLESVLYEMSVPQRGVVFVLGEQNGKAVSLTNTHQQMHSEKAKMNHQVVPLACYRLEVSSQAIRVLDDFLVQNPSLQIEVAARRTAQFLIQYLKSVGVVSSLKCQIEIVAKGASAQKELSTFTPPPIVTFRNERDL
jgi:hypothetical protein